MASTAAAPKPEKRANEQRAYLHLAILLGLALAALLVVWLIKRGDDAKIALPPANAAPVAVSQQQLETLAESLDHPVYWAGPKSGTYELTRTSDGRTYIRYLPGPASIGDRAPKYLTIGTYPTKTAFLGIRRAAKRKGAVSLAIDNGGLLVFNETAPKSVYFGYPKAEFQVEVFDPSPQRARSLVLSGRITPIK